MAALREHLAEHGFSDVATFIASGNVRVTCRLRSTAKVEKQLEDVLGDWLDFDVPAMVRTPEQMRELYAAGAKLASPLKGQARHYAAFLRDKPTVDAAERLHSWDEPGERVTVLGREVHLWLSSERPKLTNSRMERIADTVATARDWNTVSKLTAAWC